MEVIYDAVCVDLLVTLDENGHRIMAWFVLIVGIEMNQRYISYSGLQLSLQVYLQFYKVKG